ncbi:MAG TPA: DNA polymerase III subunit alpha [Moorella mulderi]|nr:DNA polymerase III subunit alpha [Moorella mulderi]
MSPFVHLHVHSQYSLLDGAARIEEAVKVARQMGMPALALTDHGVMYGAVEFYKAAWKEGVKPIIGCEVYVAPRTRHHREPRLDDYQYHLVLLAADEEGYHNLTTLVSLAFLEGFYYKPRVDRELLSRHSRGLIVLSGCLAGEIPDLILKGQEEEAYQAAAWYREIFGENFYLEIQDHGLEEERQVNRVLVEMSRRLDIPLVATNDVHYIYPQEARLHDILLCIQTAKNVDDPDRLRFPNNEFYLKSPEEMAALFAEIPFALKNTLEIAEKCNFHFSLGKLHLPVFPLPEGMESADVYLRHLCEEGLRKRYPQDKGEAKDRLEHELRIIQQMGYAGYFLIVWDIVNYARRKGIPVGPGRGSAAGSLVAYCLGITSVDPLRYNLLFERFLNPERVSMPDIDIDFCFERRDEVIRYVIEKYGEEHVAQITTFGTMAARAAVRDVGRVLGVPLSEVDRLAKMVPMGPGITLEVALKENPELRQIYQENPRARELLDLARAVEGFPRHASTHAAGLVISQKPLTYYLPLQKTGEAITTQYSMQAVEELGLLKLDLLGLRTLTVMEHTRQLVELKGEGCPGIEEVPLEDEETYALLSRGETCGVFQLESRGMRALLQELKPSRFEDLIALLALYRPGPLGSGMVEDFIKRKHGLTSVEYLHPALEPILRDTYGVILYQEQVMRIASELAGFTLGQADLLRRAMGKKKPEELLALKDRFLKGAQERNVPLETANKIFELMEYFAGYGFNASHSAAYATVAYYTAYLKAHHPAEFMCSLLSSVAENQDKMAVYLAECNRMGIKVLPPDINESGAGFTVVKGAIRFGLAAVKNVGRAAVEAILAAREAKGPFRSFLDFCRRVDLRVVNRRVVESLINCGAFNSLHPNRRQLLAITEDCLSLASRDQENRMVGQLSLWEEDCIKPPPLEDFSLREILALEKDLLGFYLSGHPLQPYADLWKNKVTHALAELKEMEEEAEEVVVGGIVSSFRSLVTRRGEVMGVISLEDFTGQMEVVLFPKVFYQYRSFLEEGKQALLIAGRLDRQEEEVKVLAEKIWPLEEPAPRLCLILKNRERLRELKGILSLFPGSSPVYLHIAGEGRTFLLNRELWVSPHPELLKKLTDLLEGDANVRILS